MKYKIEFNGEIIATFKELQDAEHFLEEKRRNLMHERNSALLDRIAEETGLDRRYPGAIPNDISMRYYKEEKEEVSKICRLVIE